MTTTIQTKDGNRLIACQPVQIGSLNLVAHRRIGKPNQRTISCPRTGFALYHSATLASAKVGLTTAIEKYGEAAVAAKLAAEPDVEPATEVWTEPAKEAVSVANIADAIADAIADRAGVPVEYVRAALNRRSGRLLSRRPADPCASAAWLAIQPNPFKVSVGACLFLRGEARSVFDKLSKFTWPVWLDADASALVELGVW